VAGLREVIEDSEISGRLDETEKEIIGNVMEFRDVDVAAVMTPRIKLVAADVDDGLLAAAQKLADSGHSRVPVYEGTLDTIIGTVSARDIVQVLATGKLHETPSAKHRALGLLRARDQAHPRADERAAARAHGARDRARRVRRHRGPGHDRRHRRRDRGRDPRRVRRGRTARCAPPPGGAAEVDATLHVSEVNELLELDLPEESDFETLGGFVLAQLGRFPQRGESFQHAEAEYTVTDASDRRVLKVRVRKLAAAAAH
jgi:CBS domain containing-hemolysin-like protein